MTILPPLVYHVIDLCRFSDGCGRTGTYCLIDMVLNRMAKGAYCRHALLVVVYCLVVPAHNSSTTKGLTLFLILVKEVRCVCFIIKNFFVCVCLFLI